MSGKRIYIYGFININEDKKFDYVGERNNINGDKGRNLENCVNHAGLYRIRWDE